MDLSKLVTVSNKAFGMSTWVNDKRHTWKEWRYGHSSLAVDGKADANLPNCAIMDNYYVESPVWMVDLGKETTVNGVVVITWQGAGQGRSFKNKSRLAGRDVNTTRYVDQATRALCFLNV
jgi:hypothetical protein